VESSSASGKRTAIRRWRYGVNKAVRFELLFGSAAGEIEKQTEFSFLGEIHEKECDADPFSYCATD
jgi:hypothetical protein